MESRTKGNVTVLLQAWRKGDQLAAEQLFSTVHGELLRIASGQLRSEQGNPSLQPAVLVNEAYLRLNDQRRVCWRNRAHFFAIAAKLMRRIALDHARRRQAKKRPPEAPRLSRRDQDVAAPQDDFFALHETLRRLAEVNPARASVVNLRFFGGFKVSEVAEKLGCSKATVERHWGRARVWLYRELSSED